MPPQFTMPSDAFSQYNIEVESNTASYSNAEIIDMSQRVYHFAQQKSSAILPHLHDTGSMKGQFIQKDRFGKFEFKVRTKNVDDTPHTAHENSTRGVTSVKLHAGHIMDMDDIGRTRYAIQPKVLMELSNSLGRSIDRVIYTALYQALNEYTTTAGSSFDGTQSVSKVSLADASKYVLGSQESGTTKKLIRWTGTAVDDLIESFEDDDFEPSQVCILMTPAVRRQLKKIKDFRDAENNQSFRGREDSRVIVWRDLTWISISKQIQPPASLVTGADKYVVGNQFAGISSSGAAVSGFTGYSTRLATFAFAKPAIMFRFHENFYSRLAARRDLGDAAELYCRTALAALRVDDKGVRQIVFGTAEPSSSDLA